MNNKIKELRDFTRFAIAAKQNKDINDCARYTIYASQLFRAVFPSSANPSLSLIKVVFEDVFKAIFDEDNMDVDHQSCMSVQDASLIVLHSICGDGIVLAEICKKTSNSSPQTFCDW